VPLITNVKPLQ